MADSFTPARPLARLQETRFGRTRSELRALVDEVADVDWSSPTWNAFASFLAATEALGGHAPSADAAAAAFITALEANGARSADTFMAAAPPSPPTDAADRVALAVVRARAMAEALVALDGASEEQPLLQRLHRERGWLRGRSVRCPGGVPIAFLVGSEAYVARVSSSDDPEADDLALARALCALPARIHPRLRRVDPTDAEPTEAVAVVSLAPVSLAQARSFHRAAWTRGGGPWTGVADAPPHAVVSTCHAAVDGYAHARLTAAVLDPRRDPAPRRRLAASLRSGADVVREPRPAPAPREQAPIGFASALVEGPTPRFARAMHAFAAVLDDELGDPLATRSVPFHVPIAPGDRADAARWRRRPLYGLMALAKRDGELESAEAFGARLPAFLEREASGAGLLARVLRGMLSLPLPLSVRRALIARKPGADRFFPAAQVLTGGGYLSWMRFPAAETPRVPTFPSAVPSFAAGRGGAGLSIAHADGGLAAGLTTSGELGTDAAAARFLDRWLAALDRAR